MKPLFLMILVISSICSFGQSKKIELSDYDKYMKKKVNWNVGGWVMVGTGCILGIKGLSSQYDKNASSALPAVYYYMGGVCLLSSIPFFITADSNRKKALAIKDQPQSTLIPGKFKSLPGVTLSIAINSTRVRRK